MHDMALRIAGGREDFLTPEHDEVDVLLTGATSRHVCDLVVAGRPRPGTC